MIATVSPIQHVGRSKHEAGREPTEFISTSGADGESVRYLNDLFRRAAREGVSDVHFDDFEGGCVIRFRVRGVTLSHHPMIASLSSTATARSPSA